jgi:hypothetical protein
MSFPWTTEKQRQKQRADEDFARWELIKLQYRQKMERAERTKDAEIAKAMAEILRKQRDRPRLCRVVHRRGEQSQ